MKLVNQLIFFDENVEKFTFGENTSTKEYKFFESVKKDNQIKDRQRIKDVYGNQITSGIEVNFRKLKSRVGKKLLFGFLVNELDELNFSADKFSTLYYFYFSLAKLLHFKNEGKLAFSIYEKLFNQSKKLNFSYGCRDTSLELINFYTTYIPDKRKETLYKTQFAIWKEQCEYMFEIELFRQEMAKHFFGDVKEIDKKLLEEYLQRVENLITLLPKILDINAYSTAIDIICFVYGHAKKFIEIIEVVELFKEKIASLAYSKYNDWTIHYNLLLANVNLKKDELIDIEFHTLYSLITPGRRYWIIVKGLEFSESIKRKDYNKALRIAVEVNQFSSSKSDSIEAVIWQMKLAYINLIEKILDLKLEDGKSGLQDFDMPKFVKRTKILAKDKGGYNLNIKIIKILYYLSINNYDKAFDELDYFGEYRNRYIKKDENPRSRHFISLLLVLPNTGFHPVSTMAHSKKILDKLKKVDFVTSVDYVNNEIIPYEFLWEIIIHCLTENRKIRK